MNPNYIINSDIEYIHEDIYAKDKTLCSLASEKSYDPLISHEELMDMIAFITFNKFWIFVSTFANLILYYILTYSVIFDHQFERDSYILLIKILCNLVIIIDVTAAFVHYYWREISKRRVYLPRQKAFLIVDVISLLSAPLGVVSFFRDFIWISTLEFIFIVVRHYRIFRLFYVLSTSAGMNTQWYLLLKHGGIALLLIHTYACIWMHIGCYGCITDKPTWTKKDTYLENTSSPTPFKIYVLCLLHVVGGITSASLGGGSSLKNDGEKAVLICLMLTSIYYMNGMCLGAYTSVQVENYRGQTQFTNKFKMIIHNLHKMKASKTIIKKMLNYYIVFWKEEDAIKDAKLFTNLPFSLQKQVLLDKYWLALNQSHLFRNNHPSFKRAISRRMSTRIYIPGEIIYDIEQIKDTMVYIAKGTVNLLSTIDGESPLLSLGVGTCLGEVSLFYGFISPTKVVAASYCTAYELSKINLWNVIGEYQLLTQASQLHGTMKQLLSKAREKHSVAESRYRSDASEKLLQKLKGLLKTETEVQVDYLGDIYLSQKREEETMYDIYVLSNRSKVSSDDIFLHTSWPWILQAQSKFLDIWEIFVVLTVVAVAIGYPMEVAYKQDLTIIQIVLYRVLVQLVYKIDVIFQIFTTVETDHGILTTVLEIFISRLASKSFILDLLAITPLDYISYFVGLTEDARMLTLLSTNKLLKLYRITSYLNKIEYNFRFNIAYIRLFKYVLYLLYPAYILGALYYMVSCFKEVCQSNMALSKIESNQFLYSILTAMLIMSGTGGLVQFFNITEVSIILFCSLTGTLIFIHLVADYSATLTLADAERLIYTEMINVMRKFMTANEMVKHVQYRMNEYLVARWLDSKGMHSEDLYDDAPKQLYEEFLVKRYANILTTNPVFQKLKLKLIRNLAISCESVSLPPNEYVTYAGEVSREIYIIEKGFCEVISGSSEKVEKILGPMSSFCVIDTLFELEGIFNIRTMTHTNLIKIRLLSIKQAFARYIEEDQILKSIVADTKLSYAARRLFTQSGTVIKQIEIEEEKESWFIFPRSVVHPRNIDYLHGWSKFDFFRYLTLRRTILPYGNFILIWEIFRAIFAFLSAILYPMVHIYSYYFPNFSRFVLLFDAVGLVDIYIRLHLCYYDKGGILVTHPRCTAMNYLTSSFIIDLLGIFPTDYFIHIIRQDQLKFNRIQAFVRINKVLQVYRIPDAFNYFCQDRLKPQGVLINTVKYLMLTLSFVTTLAACIINASTDIYVYPDNTVQVVPINDSWIVRCRDSFTFDTQVPLHLLAISYYWVTITALQLSFGNIQPNKDEEVLFQIFVIVGGYLWFNYVVVIISNSKATINAHLTLYQNHMQQLIKFMKQEKINKDLQTNAIDHFEYIWQRTHGMDANMILKQCHLALRKDCALYLYEDTLKLIPIFADMLPSFYRMLGTQINENYYLKNVPILQLNDICKYVYIIHKGEVTAIGPDGSCFDTLTRGCMFGNLDNVNYTRSMVTILTNSNVDLLLIKTQSMYHLLRDYPVVINRLYKHLLLENLSYISIQKTLVETRHSSAPQQTLTEKNVVNFLLSTITQFVFMLISLMSCLTVTYQMSFRDYSIHFFCITYLLDLAHIVKMYIGFRVPYQTILGDVITDRKMIRKRYLSWSKFYLELIATLPIELFCLLLFEGKEMLSSVTWFRLNRTLRLWNVFHFFDVNYNFLNVNVLAIKLTSIFINISIVVHAEACVWFIVGCMPPEECNRNGWLYTAQNLSTCNDVYLCALYISMSITSSSGYMNIRARALGEVGLTIISTIINKILLGMVIGDMSAVAQSFSSTLTNYDYDRRKMELFLKHSSISMPLFQTVMNYTSQLWDKNEGYQIPVFMTQAPTYISASIKSGAFGYHIRENMVFMNCHPDFLRILIKRLKFQTYFTGDIITQQGDVNGTMYFIHEGLVHAYYLTEDEETHVDTLEKDDCFGMIQGLFPKTPHTHTFKANAVTSLVTLELRSWAHLLQFYPATKFMIYDKIQSI